MAGLFEGRLAREVRFVRDMYSPEKKRQVVAHTIEMYRAMREAVPRFLDRLINDYNYKMNLAHSREFCKMAGVDYNNIDMEWDNLRAGAARLYAAELRMKGIKERKRAA